jgi:hypothetical protein
MLIDILMIAITAIGCYSIGYAVGRLHESQSKKQQP